MKSQQLIDKKSIALEICDFELTQLKPMEVMVYVRAWDPEKLELTERMEIIVDKAKSLKHLGEKISEK